MIDATLNLIAPHICCSCGETGEILCVSCQEDINEEAFSWCVRCLQPTYSSSLCKKCVKLTFFDQAYVVGWRDESLKTLINLYKFERCAAAATAVAKLLDARLPVLPSETKVCYVPTIRKHIRQRGYDHMRRIADEFAVRRSLTVSPLLARQNSAVQHGASRDERLRQMKDAFLPSGDKAEAPLLLIDDIYTTGATINAATKTLRTITDQPITVAIIARQPLDGRR